MSWWRARKSYANYLTRLFTLVGAFKVDDGIDGIQNYRSGSNVNQTTGWFEFIQKPTIQAMFRLTNLNPCWFYGPRLFRKIKHFTPTYLLKIHTQKKVNVKMEILSKTSNNTVRWIDTGICVKIHFTLEILSCLVSGYSAVLLLCQISGTFAVTRSHTILTHSNVCFSTWTRTPHPRTHHTQTHHSG